MGSPTALSISPPLFRPYKVFTDGFDFSGYVATHGSTNLKFCVPAFLTLVIMPFAYNISYGIAFGLISYIVISIFCGDTKKQ